MINSLNFHGIIGKIFDVEVFKGFMHIKYLEYFSTEAYFQKNIENHFPAFSGTPVPIPTYS